MVKCPKCKIELLHAVDWAYCPNCNYTFNKNDLEALRQIQAVTPRKELEDFYNMEAYA